MKPDILLINPGDLPSPYPPMGLIELGSFLERSGYRVAVTDLSLGWDRLKQALSLQPRVVGVSVLFGLVEQARRVVEIVKKNLNSIVLLGGYYPTFMPTDSLQTIPGADFAVLGEGELPTLRLMNFFSGSGKEEGLEKIDGIAYRDDGQVKVQAPRFQIDLQILPPPNLTLLDLDEYPRKEKRRVFTVSCSRGCNRGCSFCSQFRFWGGNVRFKPPSTIIDTISQALSLYRIDYIRLLDDNFLIRSDIWQPVSQYLGKTGIPWEFQASEELVTPDILRNLRERNVDRWFTGLETASVRMQRVLNKMVDLNHAREMISLAKRVSFQIGIPGEKKEDIEETIRYASTLEADEIALFLTTPFPGTRIERIAREQGLLSEDISPDLDPSTPSMGTGFLTREEVAEEAEKFIDRVERGHHSRKGRQEAESRVGH